MEKYGAEQCAECGGFDVAMVAMYFVTENNTQVTVMDLVCHTCGNQWSAKCDPVCPIFPKLIG